MTITAPKGTEQVCEITITWKGNTLAFSTKPMSRTVTITWRDPANARFIAFDSRGGSAVPMIISGAGLDISGHKSVSMIPTKVGYTFEGWYESTDDFGNASKKFQFSPTMVDYPEVEGIGAGITLYANWMPNTDTKYTVEHYLEELNGKYVLANDATNLNGTKYNEIAAIDRKTGTTDTATAAETKNFTGFVAPSVIQQSIAPDGSTVIKLYYKRAEYTTTFSYGTIGGDTEPLVYTTKYCGTVAVPAMVLGGYNFRDFGENVLKDDSGNLLKSILITEDETYTATWEARTDTPYRAELYVEKTDGSGYVLAADPNAIQYLEGITNASVDPTSDAIAKLTDTTGLTYAGATVNGEAVSESNPAVVTTDGKLVIKLLYNRNQNDLKYMNGDAQYGETEQVRYGAKLTRPANPTKEGYVFAGWYTTADFAEGTKVDFSTYTMPNSGVTLYAKWSAGDRTYTVNHYVQGSDGEYDIQKSVSDQPAKTGETLVLADLIDSALLVDNVIAYKEAKVGDNIVATYEIPAAGEVVIEIYYERAQYTLTWVLDGGIAGDAAYTAAGKVYVGAAITAPTLTKVGYTYTWNPEMADTMPATDVTYTAVWAAGTDTAYTVKHLQQNANNNEYTEVLSESKTGTTGEQTAAEAKDYSADGFQAGVFTNAAIAADGSTVIEIKYDRVTYEVTFDANGGTLKDGATKTFRHGQTFDVTAPEREDFAFAGWYNGETKFEAATVTGAMNLTAHWTAGAVNYTVNHYVMGTNGTYPATATFTETGNGIVDSTVTLSDLKKSDYEYANGLGTAYDTAKSEENGASVTVAKNMTVNIYYERKSYSLTWDADGGEMSGDYTKGTVYYGAVITAPAVTKTGHTGGWTGVASTMPAENTAYTAQWTVNRYTITFNTDGGSTISSITQDYNTGVSAPANPTKTGYNFVKWVDENGADASVPAKMPAGNMTLKAIWEAQTYAIGYALGDGTALAELPTAHTYGQTTQIPNLTKTGYTFDGWLINGENKGDDLILGATDYTAGITLTAQWKINQYTITFTNTGDSTVDPITKDYNTAVVAPADPSREHYTFTGWNPAVPTTMPAENVTITANWTPVRYTITYNLNGGSYSTELDSYTVETESQAFGEPSRNEYRFVGWYTDPGFAENTKVTGITKGQTGDITVYAKWEMATYSITYELNGGTNPAANPSYVVIGSKVTLQQPTRQYYDFTGWTVNGVKHEADTTEFTLQGNSTFTANWELTKYTVTLDLNGGGSVTPTSVQVQYGMTYNSLPTPTRTDYAFIGWFTEASGGTQVTDATAITADNAKAHTLYAHWGYNVTFDANGGAFTGDGNVAEQPVNVGSPYGTLPTAPTKTDRAFIGWNTKQDGTGNWITDTSTAPATKHTLYAQWGYGITICGVAVTEKNCDEVYKCAFGYDGRISYDPGTNTVTMSGDYLRGYGGENALIYVADDSPLAQKTLTVNLTVKTLFTTDPNRSLGTLYGIYSPGDLTFTGGGSLEIMTTFDWRPNKNYGIWCGGKLSIKDGCTLKVSAGAGSAISTGIHCTGALYIENSCTLTVASGLDSQYSYGIECQEMHVNGGTVTATGANAGYNSCGIICTTTYIRQNGAVTATGKNAGYNSYGFYNSNSYAMHIRIVQGTLTAEGKTGAARVPANGILEGEESWTEVTLYDKDGNVTDRTATYITATVSAS